MFYNDKKFKFDPEIKQVIAKNIRKFRLEKGYTQEQMAEQLNVSCKFLSMIERGVSGVSITNLTNICKVLDIEPNSVFNGILNYTDSKDEYITNALSTLANRDKEFLISVIEYILKKS